MCMMSKSPKRRPITVSTKHHTRYFGTDGIRGRFGSKRMHPVFLLKLGAVLGALDGVNKVVIGQDTRQSKDAIQSALVAGLVSVGVDVVLVGVLPTSGVSIMTRKVAADMGIMISASHNPHADNGIKLFDAQGAKLSDAAQDAINHALNEADDAFEVAPILGQVMYLPAYDKYIGFCHTTLGLDKTSLAGLSVVIDTANGAASPVARAMFEKAGAHVYTLHDAPDGTNINANCGAVHPNGLQRAVVAYGADMGIALDGDADRLILVDAAGKCIDGDGILYLLAVHAVALNLDPPNFVVGTLMTNEGLNLALTHKGIELIRTLVGDRHVFARLKALGGNLGAESSGHIALPTLAPTGDALLAALLVARLVIQTPLNALLEGYAPMPQVLLNVVLDAPFVGDVMAIDALQDAFAKARSALQGGRFLVRPSGTEPVIRVMVEDVDAKQADAIAQALAQTLDMHFNA